MNLIASSMTSVLKIASDEESLEKVGGFIDRFFP